jgi:hypothetical protein
MNIDQFWRIVDDVHRASGGDMNAKCEMLRLRLMSLSSDELNSFVEHFDGCDARAYNHPLWGAIYTLRGGCSDDSFQDFRATLISMGRAAFEQTLAAPDNLADLELPEDPCFEGFQYVVIKVSLAVTGGCRFKSEFPLSPTGANWREDQLPQLYPKLTALNRRLRAEYRARRGFSP